MNASPVVPTVRMRNSECIAPPFHLPSPRCEPRARASSAFLNSVTSARAQARLKELDSDVVRKWPRCSVLKRRMYSDIRVREQWNRVPRSAIPVLRDANLG